jgi:hypothetical protein
MTLITREGVLSMSGSVRCDLARARRRAGLTLAKLHAGDEIWQCALTRDYYDGAQSRWEEFLRSRGETRAILRYEFLSDFAAWLFAVSLSPIVQEPPGAAGGDSTQKNGPGPVCVVGFFGNDALLISEGGPVGPDGKRKGSKSYRILHNEAQTQSYSSLLRLPKTKSLSIPHGDAAVTVQTGEGTNERLVVGHDSCVVLGVAVEGVMRFRIAAPGQRLEVTPAALAANIAQFGNHEHAVRQLRAALATVPVPLEPVGRPGTAQLTSFDASLPDTTGILERNRGVLPIAAPSERRPSISTALRFRNSTVMVLGDANVSLVEAAETPPNPPSAPNPPNANLAVNLSTDGTKPAPGPVNSHS